MSVIEANGANAVTEVFRSNVEDLALEELTRLEARKQQLDAEVAALAEGIRAAKSVLRSVRPQMKPGPKKSKASGGQVLSPHRLEQITTWLTGKEDEFTIPDARDGLQWSESQVAVGLAVMRDNGAIRIARMGGKTGSQKIYRSMI